MLKSKKSHHELFLNIAYNPLIEHINALVQQLDDEIEALK